MPLKRRDLVSALKKKGFRPSGGAGHDQFFLRVDGVKRTGVHASVPRGGHGSEIGDGLIKWLGQEMHLSKRQLVDFTRCTLSHDDYCAVLRAKGVLPPAK